MEFKDIQRVNSNIRTTDIKGKEYAEVNQRVMAFRELEPNGRIETQIVSLENGIVVIKASAYGKEGNLLSTGYAYEKENSTFINKTSYIENCETSAVGRCLGFIGLGIDTSIASYEEVGNAIEQQKTNTTRPLKEVQNELKELCKVKELDFSKICREFKVTAKSTVEQLEQVIEEVKGR